MTAVSTRPKLVLLGILTKIPVGGVSWQVAQYLLGFRRLGYDVYYVESHAGTPSMLMRDEHDDSTERAVTFLEKQMRRLDMGDRWAFHALHDDGACYGLSLRELHRLYREAALIVNLHGATKPLPEHYATGRLVYLETDPVQLQVELHRGERATVDFLQPHVAFFTSGLNYGNPGCKLPWSDHFPAVPSPPPVVLDVWTPRSDPGNAFTTIGNWRQDWRPVQFLGETYTWSKHHEFRKVLDLPGRVTAEFELALSRYQESDRKNLERHGWQVIPGYDMSRDPDTYRDYIQRSRAEFSVAKDQNVRLRTGWFSERSATYLASGRPVIVQDTAFESSLPTGEGLFAFNGLDDAVAAVEAVNGDYERHRRAANEIARAHLDSDVVLAALIDHIGAERAHRGPRLTASDPSRQHPIPDDLVLTPVSRRPLRLPVSTVERVLARPVPSVPRGTQATTATIIVVTHNNLVVTRLALESVLLNMSVGTYDVVVVDNGSDEATRRYLRVLSARNRHVRLIENNENRGFAAANNQGIAVARGEVVVLLNNDTVVPPEAIDVLVAHAMHPAVGLVGPVTNRCGNEAEICLDYATYGELLHAVDRRSASPSLTDIPVAVMFCVATRRDVLRRVGPLDERFGLGMFEDDDYAMRVRQEGLRVVCAENAFVHHFGEASLGALAASGRYGQLFEANRRLFEEKWELRWQPHQRRDDPHHAALVERVAQLLAQMLPPNARIAIVSKGGGWCVGTGSCQVVHFPAAPDGTYRGWYPRDDDEAIAELHRAKALGCHYFVLPQSARWWLLTYPKFFDHLDRHHVKSLDIADTCLVYDLRPSASIQVDDTSNRVSSAEPSATRKPVEPAPVPWSRVSRYPIRTRR